MKLRSKFYLLYILFVLLPLSLILAFSYQTFSRWTKDRMNEYSERIFQSAVRESNNRIDKITSSLRFLTFYSDDDSNSVVRTMEQFSGQEKQWSSYDLFLANRRLSSVFANLLVSNDSIRGIYLFSPSGVVFANSNPQYSSLAQDYDARSDAWYKDTLSANGRYYIFTQAPDAMFTDQSDSIYFSLAISNIYTHEFLGILLADCDPEILNLTNINSLPDITLLEVENTATSSILYSNRDTLRPGFDNRQHTVRKQSLNLPSLQLTGTFDKEALYNTYWIGNLMLYALVALCSISMILLVFFIASHIVKPLETLAGIMAHQDSTLIANETVYTGRHDEIGMLYREYSQLLENINAYIKKDYKDRLILLDAQMKSLEARINSHFLFNTLESINSMAELADNEPIASMSMALGNMFRYAIKTDSEIVTLADELNHVADYVSIQGIRFSHRFTIQYNVPEELRRQKVLKLILQPLVENALSHGLEHCTAGDQIRIGAQIDKTADILLITVEDNGRGITTDALNEIQLSLKEEVKFTELGHRSKQSIGLKNIHSRIVLYYGDGFGLKVESKPENGTKITIRIPTI